MRVRVYNRQKRAYFQSELYAIFYDGGFARYLVEQDGILTLMDRFSQSLSVDPSPKCTGDGTYRSQIFLIDPDFPSNWLRLTNGDLRDFPDFPKILPEDKWTAFWGYPWVWEDRETVKALLSGAAVPRAETRFAGRTVSSLLPGWNYVRTQAEADNLLNQTRHFHDSVLVELHYVSGSRRTRGGMLCSDSVRRVTMLFHCDWCPPVELVFEAVEALDLCPADEDHCSVLYGATLRVRDAAVFFCDSAHVEDEAAYPGTKIRAYSLRWRFCRLMIRHLHPSKGVYCI